MIEATDYFEVSEDELLEIVSGSFHALRAFIQSIGGDIKTEDSYEESNKTPLIVSKFKELYRYAEGRDRFADELGLHMRQTYTFAIMADDFSDCSENSNAQGAAPLKRVVIQAYARYKVDRYLGEANSSFMDSTPSLFGEQGFEGLSILQLALLSRMKQQSVKNKLSTKSDYPLIKGKSGKHYMNIEHATEWLKQQNGFSQPTEGTFSDENTISVPVSRDGSVFGKGNKGPKGFRVGPKGEEVVYSSFDDALDALKKMPTPYWRRPSKTSGIPGIVSGVRWERRPLSELTDA